MTKFNIHTVESAPEAAKDTLQNIEKKLGSIPGLFGALAESPAALSAYPQISDLFDKTNFTKQEQQILLIAISVENECLFCVPAHSFIAKNIAKVDPEIVKAVREKRSTANDKLDALVNFAQIIVKNRGHVEDKVIEEFIKAGYSKEQVIDVILGVTLKTFSNYVSHITNPPLGAFAGEKWDPNQ